MGTPSWNSEIHSQVFNNALKNRAEPTFLCFRFNSLERDIKMIVLQRWGNRPVGTALKNQLMTIIGQLLQYFWKAFGYFHKSSAMAEFKAFLAEHTGVAFFRH